MTMCLLSLYVITGHLLTVFFLLRFLFFACCISLCIYMYACFVAFFLPQVGE